jgi:hypothetical protein
MEESGYCTPHNCKLCQQILIDLSERSLSNRLKPLHNRIESWPLKLRRNVSDYFFGSYELASSLTGRPGFMKTTKTGWFKANRRRSKAVFRLLYFYEKVVWCITGCPSINKRVDRAFSTSEGMASLAERDVMWTTFYSISRQQLDDNAAAGCTFFQALVDGFSSLSNAAIPLQDPEFVLASKGTGYEEVEIGVAHFRNEVMNKLEISSLYNGDLILDDGM